MINPKVGNSNLHDYAPSGLRYCVEHGKSAVASSVSGNAGCNSCLYTDWNGTLWTSYSNCNSCAPYASLTCY